MQEKWPIQKALMVLLGSIFFNLSLSFGGYFLYSRWKQNQRSDEQYKIAAIVQTGPKKEALKTVYLAELLGLSVDAPKNLYAFRLDEAVKSLLSSPLIASAELKRTPPATLYVDYEVRKPLAWLSDYRNTAVDREGYLFPVAPFFSPQEMPEIYLGLPPFGQEADSFGREGGKWQAPLHNRYLNLAFDLLQTFEGSPWKEGLRLKRIDVSNAYAPSLGRREIVLFTEEELCLRGQLGLSPAVQGEPSRAICSLVQGARAPYRNSESLSLGEEFFKKGGSERTFVFSKILRLTPKDYKQQLQNFFALRKSMLEDYRQQLANVEEGVKFSPRIIDLRIPQLAFVEN